MLDLSSLPRGAVAIGLQYNLERLGTLPKVYEHFLAAVLVHLDADAVWLRRTRREGRVVSEDYGKGQPRHRDEKLIENFLRNERPSFPRSLLLSPLRAHGRTVGIVGAERHGREFERGRGWVLNRLASKLANDVSRREEARVVRVLDSIKEKVVAELRPRDLSYQILDGLYQLVHYDHSAALLIHEPERRVLRVEADKIAWTKAKSAFIGHEVSVTPGVARALASKAPILTTPSVAETEELFELLYFHRGDSVPEPTSILCAPLYYDGALLGVLKIAARARLPFDERDRDVAERFLPAASLALRNARERASLEHQALEAENRAGLVTLARAVAHDVNNAIGSLLPLAEQVRDDLSTGAVETKTLVEDMDVVIDKATLCKRIFSNMMKLGSGRSGTGPVDVHALIHDAMPMLSAHLEPRRIDLDLDLAEAFPIVTFSKAHLERIVWNLVTNAADAVSESGGAIVIRTELDGKKAPRLIVADDGPGIPADELKNVMEPFYSTKENGNGLGLSVCRSLAWESGGSLKVQSEVGRGTQVVLTFPAEVSRG